MGYRVTYICDVCGCESHNEMPQVIVKFKAICQKESDYSWDIVNLDNVCSVCRSTIKANLHGAAEKIMVSSVEQKASEK